MHAKTGLIDRTPTGRPTAADNKHHGADANEASPTSTPATLDLRALLH